MFSFCLFIIHNYLDMIIVYRDPISHSGKQSSMSKGYPCPYPGCSTRGIKRLDVHLVSQHGLKVGTQTVYYI